MISERDYDILKDLYEKNADNHIGDTILELSIWQQMDLKISEVILLNNNKTLNVDDEVICFVDGELKKFILTNSQACKDDLIYIHSESDCCLSGKCYKVNAICTEDGINYYPTILGKDTYSEYGSHYEYEINQEQYYTLKKIDKEVKL